jgi:membrane protein YqaA with SNARE-associated domain
MFEEYGPLGLLFSAFLAATILPFSSEIALVGAVELGMSPHNALIYASLGNCLAVLLNYLLGYYLYTLMQEKIQHSKIGTKAYTLSHKYGYFALILSPLPIIGDPITIASGLIRLNIFWFIAITFTLRVGRYYLILFMLQ